MSGLSLRTLCSALGFTAVVIQGGKLPKKDAALRATSFANLIEAFCREGELSSPANLDRAEIDAVIEKFKKKLTRDGDATLPTDRGSLIAIYDRLMQRQARRERQYFYDTANDNLIANAILVMIDKELEPYTPLAALTQKT